MQCFLVQFRCQLGCAYDVAEALSDAEVASEIYSTSGDWDLLAKFYVAEDVDIGRFVNEKLHKIPGIEPVERRRQGLDRALLAQRQGQEHAFCRGQLHGHEDELEWAVFFLSVRWNSPRCPSHPCSMMNGTAFLPSVPS